MVLRLIPIPLILILSTALPARAQNREAMSDVLILMQPLGSESLIAVTFAKATPHARVRELLADLANRGGWKLGTVEIKEETVPADFRDPSKTAQQTGASSTISGPLKKDGGFRLQPFVEVFADYSKLEILFIENADPTYAGLRSFQGGAVTVDLIKAGAPYRYMIRIDKSSGPIPTLPLLQPAAPPAQAVTPSSEQTGSRGSMAFILFVSAASGLAVFFGLLLVTHLRSRRAVRTHYRRPSRP